VYWTKAIAIRILSSRFVSQLSHLHELDGICRGCFFVELCVFIRDIVPYAFCMSLPKSTICLHFGPGHPKPRRRGILGRSGILRRGTLLSVFQKLQDRSCKEEGGLIGGGSLGCCFFRWFDVSSSSKRSHKQTSERAVTNSKIDQAETSCM
jgi:hypothetical protein